MLATWNVKSISVPTGRILRSKPAMNPERECDFTLALKGEWDDVTDEMADRFFEAGCDDATIALRSGRIFVSFTRSAPNMIEALLSAVRDVRTAGFVVERVAECELVSQADIARRTDRSRQQINQWVSGTRSPQGFPPPACQVDAGSPLYSWCEVTHWLYSHDLAGKDLWDDAEAISTANSILNYCNRRHDAPELFASIFGELSVSAGCKPCD